MEHSVLEQALQALNTADNRITELLSLRRQLGLQVAQLALVRGTPYRLEERIAAVVSRLARDNPGPLETHRLARIFAIIVQLTEVPGSGLAASNGAAKKG